MVFWDLSGQIFGIWDLRGKIMWDLRHGKNLGFELYNILGFEG